MHGTGNVILVVDQRGSDLSPPNGAMVRRLGDDATGPGFDQMMWISASECASFIARYRVFNADGGEVEQCGNGVRCVAKYLASIDNIASYFATQGAAVALADSDTIVRSSGKPVEA